MRDEVKRAIDSWRVSGVLINGMTPVESAEFWAALAERYSAAAETALKLGLVELYNERLRDIVIAENYAEQARRKAVAG